MRYLILALLFVAVLSWLVVPDASAHPPRGFVAGGFYHVGPQVVFVEPRFVARPVHVTPVVVFEQRVFQPRSRTRQSQGGVFGLGFIGPNRARARVIQ